MKTLATKDLNPETELEQLYNENKQHIGDLLFFEDEVRFLKSLLDQYFLLQLKDDYVNKIQMISSNLQQLQLVKDNITKDTLTHQGNLEVKFKDIVTHDIYFFRIEGERINEEMNDLNRSFRTIKKEIFHLSKHMASLNNKALV